MKYILMTVLGVTLVGCENGVQRHSTGAKDTFIFQLNNKPIECIMVGHGLSCNWEKYNK